MTATKRAMRNGNHGDLDNPEDSENQCTTVKPSGPVSSNQRLKHVLVQKQNRPQHLVTQCIQKPSPAVHSVHRCDQDL